ncbi:SWIM zinc finger family protein [Streptomyces sp. NPDC006967]|uniref:SWIM zinc finger family protein n=2 Tax=unclassified Streptomyces TaxID=2593676 RepID=UPI0033C85740
MTPRPSDEAREALRAARERVPREPAATTDRPPAGQPHRPGDAAREALRRAVDARREAHPAAEAAAAGSPQSGESTGMEASGLPPEPHAAGNAGAFQGGRADAMEGGGAAGAGAVSGGAGSAAGASGDGTGAEGADEGGAPGGAGGDRPEGEESASYEVSRRGEPLSGRRPVTHAPEAEPSGEGPSTEEAGRAEATVPGRDDVASSGPVDSRHPAGPGSGSGAASGSGSDPDRTARSARRPGDIARDALRSARAEAERARAEDRPRPTRRRAASPAPRVPRTTRGDRLADERVREVRAALAGAFRMPTDAEAPLPEPASDTSTRGEGPPAPPASPSAAEPPATPRTPHAAPRSMAAPARDGDLRRTFPAFPPRPAGGDAFAETWWGGAWVTALEEGALDAARLARGRGYAEQGHVDAITVTPGLVLAYVRGSRPRPYRVQVRLRTFGDADWERFLDSAADRPGHIAALLDKEMPASLADCGAPLLPGPGDLDPRCSCPDSGHPCKHAAALCYQTARLLDADPFVLLLLRGRGEREVTDALSRLSAARAARAAQEKEPQPLPGVRAAEAVARPHHGLLPLPAPLPPPPHPEQPPVYPAAPGGPDPFALDQLATDAAARAHALLTTGRDPVGGLTLWHDAVRLAAARPGSGLTAATRALYSSLARAAGRSPAELARAVAAWRQGGPAGLAVLEEPWDPPAGRFDRARPLLLAADLPAFRPWRNRLTHPRGQVQLRLGRDHLWYAYESEPGHEDWWPRGTPDPDPVGALTGLDTPADL